MGESHMPIASAVILPDPVEESESPTGSSKRRQSSFAEGSSKRLRLGADLNQSNDVAARPSGENDRQSERRREGEMEERKRGQRLFGALLGTLSQSSSSTAQKRRSDIERKQQAKLKLQAEEYDEEKKQKVEALMEVRRQEQKKYDKQSMQIRHSSLLARAHSLHTHAEPVLYYKPWELLPAEEAKIKSQIEEAEKVVEQESAQFEANNIEQEQPSSAANEQETEEKDDVADFPKTVGPVANDLQELSSNQDGNTNPVTVSPSDAASKPVESPINKDHGDDGGEIVVEGEEDTVIY